LRCAIIGAVHISQALVPISQIAGFEVTVIDPRGSFATEARFPDVTISDEWPDDAMKEFKPDTRTAVVTLTHDPKLDDPALEIALKSDAFYIGCLGSHRTHASRLERLTEAGFNDADFARLHAPVGLDLGATSPAEIAVSILAEMVAAKHGKLES
jgi:xanthine dehydrogenase accessory factor